MSHQQSVVMDTMQLVNQRRLLTSTRMSLIVTSAGLQKRPRGGGGGWHCLFEGNYPLPNYRPRYFFTAPYFTELQTTAL